MIWKEIKNQESTDGKTHSTILELWVDFTTSSWNTNASSPILEIRWYDKKTVTSWNLCKTQKCEKPKCDCKVWVSGKQRRVIIKYFYFIRMSHDKFYSSIESGFDSKFDHTSYDDFTIEYCKELAITKLKTKLDGVLKQL